MTISGPESGWEKLWKTTAVYDLGAAIVAAGGLAAGGGRFLSTGERFWGWVMMALALFALTVHALKARRTYRDQLEKDSIHELRGCLMTLDAVLLGPDLDPARRTAVGLRLTIHIPDGEDSLVQALDYVGDQRLPAGGGVGRRLSSNVGIVGRAYRQAQLDPDAPQSILSDSRETENYDAFLDQMIREYGFAPDVARQLNPATMSWAAVAISTRGTVEGVLYCDSKVADFFSDSRKEDILHATAGIAYFVGLRYS